MFDPAKETTPEAKAKIAALLVVYINGIQHGPGLTDAEWAAAEEFKLRIAEELP